MNALGTKMLCKFSVSEVFKANILRACPLQLANNTEAKECPCRRRIYVNQLRVLSCTYVVPPGEKPKTWNGKEIHNPAGLSRSIKEKFEASKPKRKEKKKPMSNELAPQPAVGTVKAQPMEYSVMTMDRQMAFRQYSRIGDPVAYIQFIGKAIYESKMFGVTNVFQGYMMALCCYLEGRSPFDYQKTYHIVESKLTMKSEAMLAEFRNRGGDHEIGPRDSENAGITLIRGKKKQQFSFSFADALKEDFVWTKAAVSGTTPKFLADGKPNPAALKDNYRTPKKRSQMLWARVVSDACTAFCPEVKSGCYTPEEFDAVLDEEGNIIEGEFTKVDETAKANQAAAANAPTSYSEAPQTQPAAPEPKPEPKVEPKPEVKPDPKPEPAANPEAAAAWVYPERGAPGFDEFQASLLTHLKAAKEKILTPEQYKEIIAKKGVASAKEMDLKALHEFVMKLEDKCKAAGKMSDVEYGVLRSLRPPGN